MKSHVLQWFYRKWSDTTPVAEDYNATFGTAPGQRVMAHLMDTVYCTIYEGADPIAAAHHTGRRSVVHEMLEIMDAVENPRKSRYYVPPEQEQPNYLQGGR